MVESLSSTDDELWHLWRAAGDAVMVRVARDLGAEAGLSGPDYGVLSRLVDLGGGRLRQQELADSMHWDKSRLSRQLTRMEHRGLVGRESGAARSVFVLITPAGREAAEAARPVQARAVRRHLVAHVRPEEWSTIRDLCARLAVEQATEPNPWSG